MDWSKIKTIFIVAFFILDIYLIYEYTQLKESQKADDIPEESISTILSRESITYEKELPKDNQKDQYLSAKSKSFSENEKKELEQGLLKGQHISIRDSIILQSILEKPLELSDSFDPDELENFIDTRILNGDQYTFWEKKDRTITYYQQYKGKTLYRNLKGELTFILNEENKIVSYTQTFLEDIKEMDEKENIIQPLEVFLNLYTNSYIESGAEIKGIELGYYTQLDTSAQLLSPTWKVRVNNKDFYVNALDGEVIQPETELMKVE